MSDNVIRFPGKDERLQKKFLKRIQPILEVLDPATRDSVIDYAWRRFEENPPFVYHCKIELPNSLTEGQALRLKNEIEEMLKSAQQHYTQCLANLMTEAVRLYIIVCQHERDGDRS